MAKIIEYRLRTRKKILGKGRRKRRGRRRRRALGREESVEVKGFSGTIGAADRRVHIMKLHCNKLLHLFFSLGQATKQPITYTTTTTISQLSTR
jgi:hypothetical protein